MKRNIKLTLEYDGTHYHGWQEQKNLPTIQQCLREALEDLCQESIIVYGAGRTDRGVHAKGQVANFCTESKIPDFAFAKALTKILPEDIVVYDSREVPESFHAQFSAKAKAYSYNIIQRQARPTLDRMFCHWVWYPLDLTWMREAAQYLVGKKDFSGFEAADSPRKSSVRTVNRVDITQQGMYVKIQIEADGFLYHMVRNIAGVMIRIGAHKHRPDYVQTILESKDRALAGNMAPACGLTLEYIQY